MPANSYAEIIRVEVGAAEGTDPVDEVQEVTMYVATGAGTGGTGLTENVLNGEGTVSGAALRNLTAAGAGVAEVYHTGFHWQNGWLYLPVPEERIVLKAGGNDHFGVMFPTAPDSSTTFSATVVWGEVG